MKKFMYIFLSILLVLNISSCSKRKAAPPSGMENEKGTEEKKDEDKPDKNEGKKLLDQYLRALVLRDTGKMSSFYSESLKQQTVNFSSQPDPHPNGFILDTVNEKEGKLEAKAKLLSVYTGQPYFSSDENAYTIIKEKGSYVIDKIEGGKGTEIVEKDGALFMKEGGDVKGKEIVKLNELPGYMTPQGAAPDQKYSVGRDRFGPIAGDGEGKKIAMTTIGTYPSLMVMDIKEKKVKPLDLFFNLTVLSMSWSQDGSYIAVEVSNSKGLKSLFVYDAEKGKRIDDPVENIANPEKYSINTPYWISDSELVFNVTAAAGLTADEQKAAGSYKMDAKNLSLTKY